LCFVGSNEVLLPEAAELLRLREVDAAICVSVNVVTPTLADWLALPGSASACAALLRAGDVAGHPVGEFDRDLEALCHYVRAQ
jgi:hypothetical protein